MRRLVLLILLSGLCFPTISDTRADTMAKLNAVKEDTAAIEEKIVSAYTAAMLAAQISQAMMQLRELEEKNIVAPFGKLESTAQSFRVYAAQQQIEAHRLFQIWFNLPSTTTSGADFRDPDLDERIRIALSNTWMQTSENKP